MNRGHLIGYQFSGLNSEIKNLVPMTVTLYWTSFDENGTQYGVELSEAGLATSDGNVSSVTLQNVSKNANINYLDGTATSDY